jgi:hypothetical protein
MKALKLTIILLDFVLALCLPFILDSDMQSDTTDDYNEFYFQDHESTVQKTQSIC